MKALFVLLYAKEVGLKLLTLCLVILLRDISSVDTRTIDSSTVRYQGKTFKTPWVRICYSVNKESYGT